MIVPGFSHYNSHLKIKLLIKPHMLSQVEAPEEKRVPKQRAVMLPEQTCALVSNLHRSITSIDLSMTRG